MTNTIVIIVRNKVLHICTKYNTFELNTEDHGIRWRHWLCHLKIRVTLGQSEMGSMVTNRTFVLAVWLITNRVTNWVQNGQITHKWTPQLGSLTTHLPIRFWTPVECPIAELKSTTNDVYSNQKLWSYSGFISDQQTSESNKRRNASYCQST